MTLTKNKMVREIGRRTRLNNHDVQVMLEKLIDVWTEELVAGGRIELENFLVFEVKKIDRGQTPGKLFLGESVSDAPPIIYRVFVRLSKKLRRDINDNMGGTS